MNQSTRREVLKRTIVALPVAACLSRLALAEPVDDELHLDAQLGGPVFVATWGFGQQACERSLEVLNGGGSILDAVEKGIHVTELDAANNSVGVGGYPNADGIVQLDASFMDGEKQRSGAVCALEGYANPISVARRVMDATPHAVLAGRDAARFAEQQGFKKTELLTPASKQAWLDWKAKRAAGLKIEQSHDTIALLGVDQHQHLVGGCSTSGLAFKLPGRVGDSPFVGSGVYVDGKVGAAGATGVGENVLRYCASFLIVEFMRQGVSPTDACERAIRRVAEGEEKAPELLSINFVALTRDGHIGAAGTDGTFRMAVVSKGISQVVKPRLVR